VAISAVAGPDSHYTRWGDFADEPKVDRRLNFFSQLAATRGAGSVCIDGRVLFYASQAAQLVPMLTLQMARGHVAMIVRAPEVEHPIRTKPQSRLILE
jgi:hypothetical protein